MCGPIAMLEAQMHIIKKGRRLKHESAKVEHKQLAACVKFSRAWYEVAIKVVSVQQGKN